MLKAPRIPVPESGTLRACLDLLAAERIWVERRNSGGMVVKEEGRKQRFVRFGSKGAGVPDIFCTPQIGRHRCDCDAACFYQSNNDPACTDLKVYYPFQPLWVETKSYIGRQSPAQKSFQLEVEGHGHVYLLVADPDILKNWLIDHGAMRKK